MKKLTIILAIVLIILLGAGAYYWFSNQNPTTKTPGSTSDQVTFDPFNRGSVSPQPTRTPTPSSTSGSITTTPTTSEEGKLPTLRHLSVTPIGGYVASSTASSSLARYIDRGVGHIYEASSISNAIVKISNTTIPRVYESFWNKKANNIIARYMKDETGSITNFFAELRPIVQPKNSSSTDPSAIPFEIKGKFLNSTVIDMAVSPKGDRIFSLNLENEKGIGYVSGFDESKKTKVYETPLTQITTDWPEENTVAINTKASGLATGYLYLLDLKAGTARRTISGVTGLTTKVSPDIKKIIYSTASTDRISTGLFNTKDGSIQEVLFKTLAEKCVWSKKFTNEVYCAVPTEIPNGFLYPDDWYKGKVSFVDQIWHLDANTGEVHMIANPLDLANAIVDATNLSLDPKENFLYFVNKRDLTLWSLDLSL